MEQRWITPKEFQVQYKISTSTQAKYRMAKKIPYVKIGKFIKYDRIEIDKWFEKHVVVE